MDKVFWTSANWNPKLVKTPVPIILAMTSPAAVFQEILLSSAIKEKYVYPWILFVKTNSF